MLLGAIIMIIITIIMIIIAINMIINGAMRTQLSLRFVKSTWSCKGCRTTETATQNCLICNKLDFEHYDSKIHSQNNALSLHRYFPGALLPSVLSPCVYHHLQGELSSHFPFVFCTTISVRGSYIKTRWKTVHFSWRSGWG